MARKKKEPAWEDQLDFLVAKDARPDGGFKVAQEAVRAYVKQLEEKIEDLQLEIEGLERDIEELYRDISDLELQLPI